jgi:hypothetical protein
MSAKSERSTRIGPCDGVGGKSKALVEERKRLRQKGLGKAYALIDKSA